jgi:N-acetylmuramoyl-L-alanine amidase
MARQPQQPYRTGLGSPDEKPKLLFDAGHGGLTLFDKNTGQIRHDVHDTGASGQYYNAQGQLVPIEEVHLAYLLTKDIEAAVRALGFEPILTKPTELTDHVDRAAADHLDATPMAIDRTSKAPDAFAFVSIHFDADREKHDQNPERKLHPDPNGRPGIDVNYKDARPIDIKFAKDLARRIGGEAVSNPRDLKVLQAQYHGPNRPAVIIEAGNMDNKDEMTKLMNPKNRKELAEKIAKGVVDTVLEAHPELRTRLAQAPTQSRQPPLSYQAGAQGFTPAAPAPPG